MTYWLPPEPSSPNKQSRKRCRCKHLWLPPTAVVPGRRQMVAVQHRAASCDIGHRPLVPRVRQRSMRLVGILG